MRLFRPRELAFGPDAVVFHQSRVVGTIGATLLGAIFLAAGLFWRLWGAPWFVWGPCVVVAVLVVPACLGAIVALYRKSNWVLAIDRNAVWLNLRSHRNHHLPEGETVVRLEVSEIENASIYSEKYFTPTSSSSGGSTRWALRSVQLTLTDLDTQGLVEALKLERNRKPLPRTVLGVRISSMTKHYPVSAPEPGTIRIIWRDFSASDWVTPSAHQALRLLEAAGISIGRTALSERPDWPQLDGPELDSLVRTLALSGRSIEAAKLLCRRRGLALTDATRQVKEIAARG